MYLTDDNAEIVDRLVESGRYRNASEVLSEGIRLIEERDCLEAAKRFALAEAAKIGFDQLDGGDFLEVDSEGLEELMETLGQQAQARVARSAS